MNPKTTILIVDDEPDLREVLEEYFVGAGYTALIAESAAKARTVAAQNSVDVALLDIAMPELNGVEATQQMHDAYPSTQVLILSMHSTTEHIFRALQAGARGYLLKDSAGAEVADAVRVVHAGRRYLSQKIAATVIDDYIAERHRTSPLESLSSRERQILQLVAEGKSSTEIAAILFLSPKTVDTYRSRLMHKLDIGDLPSLVKFAIQHGVTPLE